MGLLAICNHVIDKWVFYSLIACFDLFLGNIDQKQYTDRIKAIIEFLGPHLSTDDLSKIWSMQSRHAIQVSISNVALCCTAG